MIVVRVRPGESVRSAMVRALDVFFGGDERLLDVVAWIQPRRTP